MALTHGHGDHVGSLDALKERLGEEVEVLIPELEARIQTGEQVVEGKLPGSWPKVTTRPDVVLQDGDWVGSLRVAACPGHSPGHVAFLDTRDRSLIAGDVFTSIGSVQVTNHFYLRFPLAQMATWDKAKDLESAQDLTRLAPTLLVVGHGPAVPRPVPAMEASLLPASAAIQDAKAAAQPTASHFPSAPFGNTLLSGQIYDTTRGQTKFVPTVFSDADGQFVSQRVHRLRRLGLE